MRPIIFGTDWWTDCDHGSHNGRSSRDPMLMLMALIGDEHEAGYDVVTGYASVDAEDGANHFVIDSKGMHRFVVKRYADDYYEMQINRLL